VFDTLGLALYPAQLTLLKLIFLELERLTAYDHLVLDRWCYSFVDGVDEHGRRGYVGDYGVAPDVLDRIATCRAAGREWFGRVVLVIGRRGSKGLIGGICVARVVWELLCLGDPVAALGTTGTRFVINLFAAQQDQAQAQFRVVADLINRSPAFKPYIAKSSAERLCLWSPAQRGAKETQPERAAIEIVAREATTNAGRAWASPVLVFDEAAHMFGGGSNRSADEIYEAAGPSLAQFGTLSLLYEASSPWDQTGLFFADYERGLRIAHDGTAQHPDTLVVQLPSWSLYEDWALTQDETFLTYDGGPAFRPLSRAMVAPDSPFLVAAEADDPVNYAVEFLAHWRTTIDAYLPADDVRRVFAPFGDRLLTMQDRGARNIRYLVHVDTSRSGANTACVVAHAETHDDVSHLIVDQIRVWRPQDFQNHKIDAKAVVDDLIDIVERFQPAAMTFDQYDNTYYLNTLREAFLRGTRPWITAFSEHTATENGNWAEAQTFRTAISLGHVHSPPHQLAERELLFLRLERANRVAAPTSGPVTTCDIADCFFVLASKLLYRPDWSERLTPQLSASLGLAERNTARTWAQDILLGPRQSERRRNPERGRGPSHRW
jgi:hypothetical protein